MKRCGPFLPGPRGVRRRVARFGHCRVRPLSPSGFRPLQGSSTCQSRGSPPRAPLIGFCPLRRIMSVRLHPGCHARAPASSGFGYPFDAFLSAPDFPGFFHPGPPMGFSPSGLFPPSGCSDVSADARPRDPWSPSHEPLGSRIFRAHPDGSRHPPRAFQHRRAAALLGFRLSEVTTGPVSTLSRAPSQAFSRCPFPVSRPRPTGGLPRSPVSPAVPACAGPRPP